MVASLLVFGSLFLSCVARKPALAERQWGINIHFEEEQPGEIQQLSHSYAISRIGATWDRIEQIKGEYNFSMYDDLYTGLHSHNVRPYWLLAFGNVHYTGDRMMPPTTDVQRTAFANYVAATMTHFKGRNITWELFNEPNIPGKPNAGHLGTWLPYGNATLYMDLYDAVIDAIQRNGLQGETLVAPASAGIAQTFLQACFERRLLDTVDALSIHPYRTSFPETVREDYAAVRALMASYLPTDKKVDILSGEWGYSTCRYPNGTIMPCVEGAQTGANSYQDQAKFLARQWLVNALEDIPVSIFYDWHNDGLNTTQGESNFGTVEHTYNNASLPYIPKPSYLAAGVLQSLFRGREFVTRHPVNTALNESDDNAYAMEFEGGRLALWKVDGTTECKQDARLKLNCGYPSITPKECTDAGCCYQPDHVDHKPWCFHQTLANATGHATIPMPKTQCYSRMDMFGASLSDLCVVNDMLELVMNDEPQYLVPKPSIN